MKPGRERLSSDGRPNCAMWLPPLFLVSNCDCAYNAPPSVSLLVRGSLQMQLEFPLFAIYSGDEYVIREVIGHNNKAVPHSLLLFSSRENVDDYLTACDEIGHPDEITCNEHLLAFLRYVDRPELHLCIDPPLVDACTETLLISDLLSIVQ